jgi:hypothetical protein
VSTLSPFRNEDLALRVEALRAEHAAVLQQLRDARQTLRASRRWSWGHFALGFLSALVAGAFVGRL